MSNFRTSGFFGSLPPVTKNLIIINFLCWLATMALPRVHIDMVSLFGLHFPTTQHFHVYQFFTYMFMHDPHSIEHVLFNMFAVFMFGRTLESVWGSKRFLLFYIVTGLGAAVTQELTWLWSVQSLASSNGISLAQQLAFDGNIQFLVTIGASGAVFGILLAFGMMFPNAPLYIMFIPIPVKAKYFVAGYGLIELVMGIANFSFDNVAHFAHLGGMIFGLILILYWKKTTFKNNGGNF
ncbi:MAG: rhomboid family intramembrane serine protease [Tannerella sp.]|jgi:membrane associated rhomboid family serine protease|nr:rhomboid family intramembrane serine protease [Tannerella sp.]